MHSSEPGEPISGAEVTAITAGGVALRASDGSEWFLPFEEYPWFREARVDAVLRVEEPVPGQLHWPELDVDLSTEILRSPDHYPLRAG
ncbi:Protein of unknown function [Thiohalospira halophila DSM 15071]|uniref:DUF2442 domain-containing protein n=1 Tax=Thiohalospira halophila DSM 15071 TaxID=1123397 RepID=A0A1I1T444_9GAMM|nr:DUF2442 domain-containing protein [Thiohalospira halophila]SFD53362.1 Protein of unknown function [Thiohalospira halophila DSM 15071]